MPFIASRGSTSQQYLDVLPTNPLAVSLDDGSSSSADEIGNLERRPGDWDTSPIVTHHLYQNRLAITAPLAHAFRRRAATSKRRFQRLPEPLSTTR
jgi:hypothetical protein